MSNDIEQNNEQVITDEQSVEVTNEASSEFSFKDHISEEFRSDSSLEDIKDLDSLAKGYIHSQKMLGSSIRIPTEDSSPEAINDFYSKLQQVPGVVRLPDEDTPEAMGELFNKLGRPESFDKYEFKDNQAHIDPDKLTEFKQTAHEMGLSNSQAQKLLGFYEEAVLGPELQNFTESKEQGEALLKQQWGSDYTARMEGAKLSAAKYSEKHPEAMQQLINSPVGNNPAFIEILSDLAAGMSETEVVRGLNKAQYGMSSEEAMDKIQEILGNRDHAYHDASNPAHSAAVQKMQSLYGKAYPDN